MNRLTVLRENMKARGMDAVIILDELNQRYLSEFAFTDGYVVVTPKQSWLITDFRY